MVSSTALVAKHSNDLAVVDGLKQQKSLKTLLVSPKPKGIGYGVSSGVNNVVKGAVGAAGVAVLAPTVGIAVGMRKGGVLGGVAGGIGGAVVGVVGAVGVAVSGVVSGIVQVGRGVVAVPKAAIAPRRGKWWNEATCEWTLTDLPKESIKLKGVPENNHDILGRLQKEIDESGDYSDATNGNVVDPFYYTCLNVPLNADQAVIKRKYYLLARKYHPDKDGNADAAEKFKQVSEAYQVLSDPQMRVKYNSQGLAASSSSVVDGDLPHLDPTLLYSFVFGSDMFYDYIGRLATATSASVGDSPDVTLEEARTIQKRRVTRLALKLAEMIRPYVDCKLHGDETSSTEAKWRKEGVYLTKASYGHEMVTTVGKIYNLLATEYEGSMDSGHGLPSVTAWAAKNKAFMEEKSDATKNDMEKINAARDLKRLRANTKKKMADVNTPEAKTAVSLEADEQAAALMMRILWTTTVVDITSTLHEVTQMVFFDKSVFKETRKERAAAVKKLGEIWMTIPEPNAEVDQIVMSTRRGSIAESSRLVYKEAAFAAMLDTVRQFDEDSSPVTTRTSRSK